MSLVLAIGTSLGTDMSIPPAKMPSTRATIVVAESAVAIRIEIVPSLPGGARSDLGIPQPHPVHAAGEPWRSRITDDLWEYNTAHPDYLATVTDARRKLRYIASLLAKELVQRRAQHPDTEAVLEQMVEVLSWVERRMSG